MHFTPSPSTSSSTSSSEYPLTDEDPVAVDFLSAALRLCSLPRVDLHSGTNGWSSPPGDLFLLRPRNYFTRRRKSPADPDYLLLPAGVDWLRSPLRLRHLLSDPSHPLRLSSPPKTFLLAVNLQVPSRPDPHSAVFYFASHPDRPVPADSLLHRFIHSDDSFRNQRFKIVNRIVKGPWLVRATVGNHAACLLGKALTIEYHRGENYLEIDVDIGSSTIATAIVNLALGAVRAVTIDMGFVVEGQEEEELPERLIGAVRISQMEMGAAKFVDGKVGGCGGLGRAKVVDHQDSFNDEERGNS